MQGRDTGSPAPSQDGDFAPEDDTGPSKKRRRTTRSDKGRKGPKRASVQLGKTRQKKASVGRNLGKDTITTSTEEESIDDGDSFRAGLIPSRPLGVQLRPRAEPEKKMDADLAEDSS